MAETEKRGSFWDTVGFNLKRKTEPETTPSITLDEKDDGSVSLLNRIGSAYGYSFSSDIGVFGTEAELIAKYRKMSGESEIDIAIEDVINEFVSSESNELVWMDLDNVKGLSEASKKVIQKEFDHVIKLLKFNKKGFEIVKRWYVDGRLTYHIVLDQDKSKISQVGIRELKYIDPRKIKKIRVVNQEKSENGVVLNSVVDEYWMFYDNGFDFKQTGMAPSVPTSPMGIKLARDSVVQITSGLMDPNNTMVLSYLYKAIRPYNMLRSLEDATIIYNLVRAPQRRAFYIDTGDMNTAKAEQYVNSMMNRHKNKTVFDITTGQVNDDRKHMTMLEDYWLPRMEGGKGTQIETLEGGSNLTEMLNSVNYFLQKLYKALNIPQTRLDPSSGMMLGRQVEISRDEVKFSKFIARLRRRFSDLFLELLERQLVIKGLVKIEEWEQMKDDISFEYASDNLFNEMKENEILTGRLDILDRILAGAAREFFSDDKINRTILRYSDEEIEEEKKQIEKEKKEKLDTGMEDLNTGFGGVGNNATSPNPLPPVPDGPPKAPKPKAPGR